MKNFFLLFIACLFLFGCATRVSYWQHYQNCAVVEKTMKGISDCGKQSRMNYINESKSNKKSRSVLGDEYMLWAELLAERVKAGELSEAAAKMKLLERNQMLAAQQRAREQAALRSAIQSMEHQQQQNKSMTCTTIGSTLYCN